MHVSGNSVDDHLRRLSDPALLAIGLTFIAGIAAFKLTLGKDVPTVDFLLIPVVGVGWYARSEWYGYAAAVAAVVVAGLVGTQALLGAALAAGTARLVLYIVILVLLGMMRRERAAHKKAAATDQQTGAANVRAFQALALSEIERSRRYGHELSLAYLDIDDFKAINDRLGHIEGDRVLLEVSHVMRVIVRSVDTVARVGGDEFAILMPETGADSARAVVDRVRSEAARLRTEDGRPIPCSIGLVTFEHSPASLNDFLDAADGLMYRAKQNGKDRIEQGECRDSDPVLSTA